MKGDLHNKAPLGIEEVVQDVLDSLTCPSNIQLNNKLRLISYKEHRQEWHKVKTRI